jgi:hypothetical protein
MAPSWNWVLLCILSCPLMRSCSPPLPCLPARLRPSAVDLCLYLTLLLSPLARGPSPPHEPLCHRKQILPRPLEPCFLSPSSPFLHPFSNCLPLPSSPAPLDGSGTHVAHESLQSPVSSILPQFHLEISLASGRRLLHFNLFIYFLIFNSKKNPSVQVCKRKSILL